MSQPFNAKCSVPNLTDLNASAGEFWVGNPFQFAQTDHNLSAYERNGIHLNLGDRRFADISYLTGADSDGDGRSVVGTDLNSDGMPELLIRQAGGGALLVRENRFPQQHWLKIVLRGTTSNRQGIGAKVTVETDQRTLHRENYPVVNFLSQAPAWIEVGLGSAERVRLLTIAWPSGVSQTLEDLTVDRTIIIEEGNATVLEPAK